MDKTVAGYFDDIIEASGRILDDLEYETDCTPERSILQLRGKYGSLQVLITELFSDKIQKYRYYILQGNRVEAGFDNAPDPRVIRMKYGKIGKEHAGENVPHLHLEDKTRTVLTEEMMFADFADWLQVNQQRTALLKG